MFQLKARSAKQTEDHDDLVFDVQHRIIRTVIGYPRESMLQTLESYSEDTLLHLQNVIGPDGGKYHEVLSFVLATAANRGKNESYLREATAYCEQSTFSREDAITNLALGVDRLQQYKKLPWFPSSVESADWQRVAGFLDLVHNTVEQIIDEFNTGASPRETRRSIPLAWSGDLSSNRYDFEDHLVARHIFENPKEATLIRDLVLERRSSKWSVLEPLLSSATPSLASGIL